MNPPHIVLIVDDTEVDRYLARRVLRKTWPALEILEARDGEEAIDVLNSRREKMPDVIFLDINMPRMDGHEFLETWYADAGLGIPVVLMLTSSNQSTDRARAERFGCVKQYIVKPIDRAAASRLPAILADA